MDSRDDDVLTFPHGSSRDRRIGGILVLVLGISEIPLAVRILLLASRPESRIPGALALGVVLVLLLLALLLVGVHLLLAQRILTIDRAGGTARMRRRTLGLWSEKTWPLSQFSGVESVRLDRRMGLGGLEVPAWSVVLRSGGESPVVGEFRTQEETRECADRVSRFAGLPVRQGATDLATPSV